MRFKITHFLKAAMCLGVLSACQMRPVDLSVCGNKPTEGLWQDNVEKELVNQLPLPYGNKMEIPKGIVKPFPRDVKYEFAPPHRYIVNSDKFFSHPVKEAGYTVFIKVKEQRPEGKWKENSRYYCFFHNDIVTDCERVHAAEPWKLSHLGTVFSDEYPK
ncbi:hypothetical protein FAI40_07305 [Acetobacteraceae bacterium]|nr:hypothetical protein FAI40_07305 [Acetobacteraceae bacterium]